MTMRVLVSACYALALACLASAKNPVEVGDVAWGRDYQAALSASKETGKPIFLLFQEVPGCAGCRQFGEDVLSDPTVVSAIERDFIPLLIHNNKGGEDGRVRKLFKEPAWNYQVVRFLDSAGKDIIPRKDRVWTTPEINQRMKAALAKHASKDEASSAKVESARVAFCQYCFWTGERKIGALPSVLNTEAGFIDGREVTLVSYDPSRITLESLVAKATKLGVATDVYLDDPRLLPGAKKLKNYRAAPPRDQKKQIQGTVFAQLTLTPEQATKVNAFARSDPEKAVQFLDAAQRQQLRENL